MLRRNTRSLFSGKKETEGERASYSLKFSDKLLAVEACAGTLRKQRFLGL